MASRYIGKGELSSDGKVRKLIAHIQDQDGRFREEPFGEVPEAEVEQRMQELLASGQFHGVWGYDPTELRDKASRWGHRLRKQQKRICTVQAERSARVNGSLTRRS